MSVFTHVQRIRLTAQQVARLFELREGRCGIRQDDGTWGDGCGWKFGVKGDYEIDHDLALENGGTNDLENHQLLCPVCHAKKTGDDHATAGHIRRSYTKHVVPSRFRKGRGWRR